MAGRLLLWHGVTRGDESFRHAVLANEGSQEFCGARSGDDFVITQFVTNLLGAVVVAIGYGIGIFAMHSIWQLIMIAVIIGAGTGMAYGAMPALIMGAVPPSETGAADSFNTLMRALGTSFASAIAGVVLAQMTISLGTAALPSENVFRVVMALAAGSAIIAQVLANFLPRVNTNARKNIGNDQTDVAPTSSKESISTH